jgi:hypothetical protein
MGVRLLFVALLDAVAANLEIGQFKYTADPAPFVHAGRLYVTTSHDLVGQQGWLMKDYCVLSTVRINAAPPVAAFECVAWL